MGSLPGARLLAHLGMASRADTVLRRVKAQARKRTRPRVRVLGVDFLAQFARVLRRDLDAVKLAITSRWSNGPVEGHINRLKMIKRQMYGRAGFERLRARVLPWESAESLGDSCTESA